MEAAEPQGAGLQGLEQVELEAERDEPADGAAQAEERRGEEERRGFHGGRGPAGGHGEVVCDQPEREAAGQSGQGQL